MFSSKHLYLKLLPAIAVGLFLFSLIFSGTALAVIDMTGPAPSTVVSESHDFAMDEFSDPWEFNQASDVRQEDRYWISNLNVAGGFLSGRTTFNDATFAVHFFGYIDAWPMGRDGMNHPIDPAQYRYLSVRMYVSQPTQFQTYWFFDQTWANNGTATKWLAAPGWQTFTIDLAAYPNWNGKPVGLRIDPTNTSDTDFIVDFIKLHKAPAPENDVAISWNDSAPGGNADLYLDNDANPANGDMGLIGTRPSNASNNWTWSSADWQAGTYYIFAKKSGVNSAPAGPFEIRSPALIQVLDPDEKGGDDYATVETGDPWDFNSLSDLYLSLNIQGITANGFLSGSLTNDDPNFYLRVGPPIDTNRYHRINYSMAYDGIFDFGLGSMSRFIWNPNGLDHNLYQTSDDITAYNQWTEYTFDLETMKLDAGAIGWNGYMTTFRFDPLETFPPRNFWMDYIYLRADDEATLNFPVQWQELRSSPPPTTVSIYYDVDNKGYDGTLVAQNIPQTGGVNTYNWDVTGVEPGLYYVYIVASDGVTVGRQYSTGPVRISTANVPVWNSGPGMWSWNASKPVAGDYNGDGFDDVAVLYGYEQDRSVSALVFLGNGTGGFLGPVNWWSSGPGNWDWAGSKLTSGDFNNDGFDDLGILYGYADTRQSKAWVFRSNGAGAFNAPIQWWDSGANNWDWPGNKLTSGDYDGDGDADLAVLYGYQNTRQSKAWVFSSNGANAFNAPGQWWDSGANNWDWQGSMISSGDYNNDTRDDLAILYGYQNERDVAAFVLPSAGGAFSGPQTWWRAGPNNWDWSASTLLSGNFSGTSAEDLGIFYSYGGARSAIFALRSNEVNAFSALTTLWDSGNGKWAGDASKVVSGKFSASGQADIATLYNYGNSQTGLFLTK